MQHKIQFPSVTNYSRSRSPSTTSEIDTLLMSIPRSSKEVLPGVQWGDYCMAFTPAFWKAQYLLHSTNDGEFQINYQLGEDIAEEVVACLLGGFGLKAELGLAAFQRLKGSSLIRKGVEYEALLDALVKPFKIDGRDVRYRFPNQKSKFIFRFLNRDDFDTIPVQSDLELRNWLVGVDGIGPKTASWITRNFLNSENVAIIDIHIYRACQIMGVFSKDADIQKNYFLLEELFLNFCRKINVKPSRMDALMWLQMKEAGNLAIRAVRTSK